MINRNNKKKVNIGLRTINTIKRKHNIKISYNDKNNNRQK